MVAGALALIPIAFTICDVMMPYRRSEDLAYREFARRLAARTEAEFGQIATGLAGDLAGLAELRAALRERMEKSVLMDGVHFARSIEEAYRRMWRWRCREEMR